MRTPLLGPSTAPGGWAARTFAVIALLAGLIAMHALSSGHPAAGHLTATQPMGGNVTAPHVAAGTLLEAIAPAATWRALAADGRSMAAPCLAVLGAGLTLVLRALAVARAGRKVPLVPAPPAAPLLGRTRRCPPPLDLVAGLCVSRT